MTELNLPGLDWAADAWIMQRPFPYIVWPGAMSLEDAAACGWEYPAPESTDWHTFTGPLEEGKQEASAVAAGSNVAALHDALASDRFLEWLRAVSGITDLVADPDRVGGGIHQSGPGARLGLHVDFNVRGDLVRAVNVIMFVGDHDHWEQSWGGHLILGANQDRVVAPLPATLVVFEAGDTSWHGHPDPMSADCPVLRRSIPAYFYRPLRDGEDIEVRSTRFLEQ